MAMSEEEVKTLVGLAVFPLQIAALILRGILFEYLGATALGAYITLYAGQGARGAEAVKHPTGRVVPA